MDKKCHTKLKRKPGDNGETTRGQQRHENNAKYYIKRQKTTRQRKKHKTEERMCRHEVRAGGTKTKRYKLRE